MVSIAELYGRYKELILYGVFGVLTTVVTWVSYAAFAHLGIELNICNILSWVCGVSFAFITNKWYVFESRTLESAKVIREFVLFIGARIFTGVIAWVLFPILLWIGLDQVILGTEGFLAKMIVTVIEIALNWVFSKYMVFRRSHSKKESDTVPSN